MEQFWRSFNRRQRTKALKDGAVDGVVLKDPSDRSMGNVYKMLPELNLRDIAEGGPDYLLDLLKYRATASLHDQYRQGVNGGPGDYIFIVNSMRVNNLRHAEPSRNCFSLFINDEARYGSSFKCAIAKIYAQTMTDLAVAANAGYVVPQSTGELILERQLYTIQTLNILIEDILEIGSLTRNSRQRPKKPGDTAVAALSKLSIATKPSQLSLQDILSNELGHKSALEDYLTLCRTQPVLLAHAVNIWFFTRPELLPDEKGRILPAIADKYISIAFFEMIDNVIPGATIWNYVCRLLQFIDNPNNKILKSIILQELINVCHLEYNRAQKLFKRMLQGGSGLKFFKRISGVYDNGTARVAMKIKPELMTTMNPQIHYMLRLCQLENDPIKAITWIKMLDDIHKAHPQERDEMEEGEWDAFAELVVIATFLQSISTLLPLPSIKQKEDKLSSQDSKDWHLGPLAKKVDLTAFAIPINNFKEPSMTEGALNALGQFIVNNTGTTMGFLYQDLVDEGVADIQAYAQQHKEKLEQNGKTESPTSVVEQSSAQVRVEQRKEKEKTRPAHSSIYDITPTIDAIQPETTADSRVFKVKPTTLETFSTLLSKSTARGSISWTAFEAAMADLNFSVIPKEGSIYIFFPPPDLVQTPLTIHRPHKSKFEGYRLLAVASKLRRAFEWGEGSFEVV